MNTNPLKNSKKTLFIKSKKTLKIHQKHFLFIIQMFFKGIDLLNYDALKKYFFNSNILPPGFF